MENNEDLTMQEGRHHPCVEITALGDGFVAFCARFNNDPFQFATWVEGPDQSRVAARIESFCAEHLSPITLEDEYADVYAEQPRVLCNPLDECFHCGRTIQVWEYENLKDIGLVPLGGTQEGILCSDRCFHAYMDGLNEPDVMGQIKE